jgi:predicted nucleic acid-binding protein
MTMTDAKPIFLDTNILAYATSPDSPFHAAARTGLAELARAGHRGVISSQVIREYYATVTRLLPGGMIPSLAPVLANIARFRAAYLLVDDTEQVTQTLLTLVQSRPVGGRQIHDANLVATMLTYGIDELYTHNAAHFARFADVITVRPLIAPAE